MIKNIVFRVLAGMVMIGTLATTVWLGPRAVLGLVFLIQCKVFQELINLPLMSNPSISADCPSSPRRLFEWMLYGIASYWCLGYRLVQPQSRLAECKVDLVCMMLYTAWFCGYVYQLNQRSLSKQLMRLCWLHCSLLLSVLQMPFMVYNMQKGLIWFVLPASLVAVNDISAYTFGLVFGRHQLSFLSPRKTWEGFGGGLVATLLFGYYCSKRLVGFQFLTCEASNGSLSANPKCNLLEDTIEYHGIVLGLYASLAAPFSGFLASALKRSCKFKDFGQFIPGHGGMTDRMDCQLFMPAFTYFYCTFVAEYLYEPKE
ncbi:phosphatidate cytidylyltransferase [Phycomyces nitens]|nr:phosphatidate cytidylyltransferase [Phycomyces nitens]